MPKKTNLSNIFVNPRRKKSSAVSSKFRVSAISSSENSFANFRKRTLIQKEKSYSSTYAPQRLLEIFKQYLKEKKRKGPKLITKNKIESKVKFKEFYFA